MHIHSHPLTAQGDQGPDLMGSHLDLHSGAGLLGGTVAVVFLLTLQELPEMVLKQEGGVELPHGDLVICKAARRCSAVSVSRWKS